MFHKVSKITLVAALALTLTACDSESSSSEENNGATNNNGTNNGVTGLQVLPSANPRVKFKGGDRWANQMARGLSLDRTQMCREFGQYDCASDVHFIALGGVEPYKLRIDEPLPKPPISAPIAVDRIALSACSLRAELDFATPADAKIFGAVAGGASPSSEELQAIGTSLYQNLLSRDADAEELTEFEAFWAEIQEDGGEDPALEWATYSCYAIATSTEMLFY